MMRTMRWLMLGLLGVAAGPALAEPTTQRSGPRVDRPRAEMSYGDDDRPERDRMERRGGRGNLPGGGREPWFPPLNAEEVERAEAFMREHMPNTIAVLERLPEPARRRPLFPPRMQAGFRMMFDAEQKGDTAMQELLEKQFKLRDEFVGMRLANPDVRPMADPALRAKIREIAETNLELRRLRLQRMREQLKQEEDRLEKEQHDPDAMIERQMRSLWEESNWIRRVIERQGSETQPSEDASTAKQ